MTQLRPILLASAILSLCLTAFAQDDLTPAPPDGYMSVSEIVSLPEFIPGVGALYIHPDNAPVGPWLSYGNDGNLVEVLFMVPVAAMQDSAEWVDLAAGTFAELGISGVQHVDISFNGGHPGMEEPHYHFRLVVVDEETQQAALTE